LKRTVIFFVETMLASVGVNTESATTQEFAVRVLVQAEGVVGPDSASCSVDVTVAVGELVARLSALLCDDCGWKLFCDAGVPEVNSVAELGVRVKAAVLIAPWAVFWLNAVDTIEAEVLVCLGFWIACIRVDELELGLASFGFEETENSPSG
jgi:hypothetical protein